jgi:fatty-acyl-CoA synthase
MSDPSSLYASTTESALLIHALASHSDRTAIHGERTLTYGQLHDEISRYAQALRTLGLQPGQRVGLLSGNRVEVIFVNFAVSLLGCVLVPFHPKGSLRDHQYFVRDGGVSALIYDASSFAERALQLRETGVATLLALGEGTDFATSLTDAAAQQQPDPLQPPDVDPEAIARLSYSGGTTGEPKAIAATYRTLLTKTMIQLVEWEWPSEVRQLVCAPLSHAGGAMVLPTLLRGGSLFILPAFESKAVLAAIERHRISCVLLVPTMINALLDHPDFDRHDLSSLEVIYYGASAMTPARLREGIRRFGPVFFQFYGQTEAPMTVTVLRRHEHDLERPERLASCGRPVPWLRVALLDDEGRVVERGTPGEICVRGPLVMKHYWNKPEQTAEAFKHGWLHTGDMAVEDHDGFLRIVDRKKDMIISGGFNVFASEVEGVLGEHPSVATCAVFGIPDPHWGEAVAATVVLRAGFDPNADELVRWVREAKGPVQAPKTVEFVAEIPMTALGKPDKKALRARHATLRS